MARQPFIRDGLDAYYNPEMAEIIRNEGQKNLQEALTYISHNTDKMNGYTVLKLADLAKEIGLPPSKGMKTKDYLELVIDKVEKKGLRFVQFLQLVDVLYVITQKVVRGGTPIQHVTLPPEKFRPEEEIKEHYNVSHYAEPLLNQQVRESTERSPVIEPSPEMEELQKRDHLDKNLVKKDLPWKK
jgi:hypothetical protein